MRYRENSLSFSVPRISEVSKGTLTCKCEREDAAEITEASVRARCARCLADDKTHNVEIFAVELDDRVEILGLHGLANFAVLAI